QVVLGQRRPGGVAGPDEALAAEGGLGHLRRDLAEPRLAADLAAVREQGLPLAGEHRPDVDGGGDALLPLEPWWLRRQQGLSRLIEEVRSAGQPVALVPRSAR